MRLFLLLFVTLSCLTCESDPPVSEKPAPAPPPAISAERQAPDELFGELFRRVQMERIFADGKTFVDMVPTRPVADIMGAFAGAELTDEASLKAFVEANFDPPVQTESGFESDADKNIVEHINALWPVLTRTAGSDEGSDGSLLTLPNDYVVPGGRFREVYYWDSYFTLLGLQASGEKELVRDMVENFAYLIDTYGFIPNGNRSYYLTRSQPPFFSLMVGVLAEMEVAETVFREFYPQLEKEYAFWMKGVEEVSATQPAVNHVVRMPDGSLLNRYYDAGDRPRAESYREDVLAIRESGRDSQTVARHLRSGAESGWDYSARWFADGENISSIVTTDIVPPDLNSLLFNLERVLERYATEPDSEYAGLSAARKAAMGRYLWDEELGYFQDYNRMTGKLTGYLTLAGMYPLFVNAADESQAKAVAATLKAKFLAPGGLRTSLVRTGQQWDAPNGWPPLQWMAYAGLRDYGHADLAEQIRDRWMRNNERVYENVTKMVEKYNVEDITLEAGGGEYPVQDGFGWSNGVYLRMVEEKED